MFHIIDTYTQLKIDDEDTKLTNETEYDKGFVLKITENGEYSWSAEITDEMQDVRAVCVLEDSNKNIIVGANTENYPKIIEYDEKGTNKYTTEIKANTNIEGMTTKIENDGIIVISADKIKRNFDGYKDSATGRIDTYSTGKLTNGITTDFSPVAIVNLNSGKHIIVGNYIEIDYEYIYQPPYRYNGIIVEYDENMVSNERHINGINENIITSLDKTYDGGFIVGAYIQVCRANRGSFKEGVYNIEGWTDGLIMKYGEDGTSEGYRQLQGSEMEQVTDIAELAENEYVAVGYFNSPTVSANYPTSRSINLNKEQNTDGFIIKYVDNYYDVRKETNAELDIVKSGTSAITSKSEKINYKIEYLAKIENYVGVVSCEMSDTLPYKLDLEKMKEEYDKTHLQNENWLEEMLDGGQYYEYRDEITWDIEGGKFKEIFAVNEAKEIKIEKNITVIFKGVGEEKTITNNVEGYVDLMDILPYDYETDKIEKEATYTTNILPTKNLKVTKTWNDDNNKSERPSKIEVQVKEKNKEEPVATYILSEEENWTHIFTDLPKYDEEGNEIEYTVDEVEVAGGGKLSYYEREK